MHDLAIIIVSTNEAQWLPACLGTLHEAIGDISVDVVVADNRSTDGTAELVARDFPWARVVTCENLGFSHANNAALKTCDARYVLFLNPDTEVVSGTFAELVEIMDRHPLIGLAGARQIEADGTLHPTMRRFPSALRTLCETLGAERLATSGRPLGERELRTELYEQQTPCDWTSGSFMFARREAIAGAGFMDERFFVFSEEVDFCLRIKQGGWQVMHLPQMTIIHHATKSGISPKRVAQDVFGRMQYSRKHFSPGHRLAYRAVLTLRHCSRFAYLGGGDAEWVKQRRAAARWALRVIYGRTGSPFTTPPPVAVEAGWPDLSERAAVPAGSAAEG